MIGMLFGLVLLLLAITAAALQRLYSAIPVRELKRLARRGDALAKRLYQPVAYGRSVRLLLWMVVAFSLSGGLLLTIPQMPAALTFLVLSALVIVLFVLVPSMRLTVHSAQFAAFLSPVVAGIVSYVARPLDRLAGLIGQYRELAPHSQLYEKEDLMALLDLQKEQVDNRILEGELELTGRVLSFGDKQAADAVLSRKQVQLVNADDILGPVLLDQLHASGQSSFLVYKDKKDNIIGSLSLKDAVDAKKDIRVFDLIHHDLVYVHEDFTLKQVMAAFQHTGQQVAVVINRFEEFLGVITLDALLKELVGEPEPVPVEGYENRSAVAAYRPTQKEADADEQQSAPEESSPAKDDSSPDTTEVVE